MSSSDIHKEKEKFLIIAENRLDEKVRKAENELYEALQRDITREYETGTLTSLLSRITRVFKTWIEKAQSLISSIVSDQIKGSDLNRKYFISLGLDEARINELAIESERRLLEMFGVNKTGESFAIIEGGFLSTVLEGSSIRSAVVKEVSTAFVTGQPFESTVVRIRELVQGADDSGGLLAKHYRTYVYDSYQKKDRIEVNTYAQEFGLDAGIYSGTVIEKTRAFCKSKAGKVFTRTEMQQWKSEDWSGKNEGYDPEQDLGGWNCRHNLRWISNQEAVRRRPDLEINEQGKLVTKIN